MRRRRVSPSMNSVAMNRRHSWATTNLIDGDDIRMVKRRSSLRLLHEAPHAFLVCSHLSRQNLQRHRAIEFGILCQIDLTHPARAELRTDFVMPKFGANRWHH